MARNFETPNYEQFLRVAALIDAAAAGIGSWRLIVHVPVPPKDQVMKALAALESARVLADHAVNELNELEIAGPLRSRAQSWQAEGARLIESAQALLAQLPAPAKPRRDKSRKTKRSKK